jgi:hypothetical protein
MKKAFNGAIYITIWRLHAIKQAKGPRSEQAVRYRANFMVRAWSI